MRELRALRDEGFQFMSLPSAQVSEQTADQLFGSGAAEESRLMQLEGAATLGAAGAIMNDVNELFGENVGAVRLAIGRGVGKVAGQVPLIGDVAEEFLTENIAGASAQKLASFRSKQMAFVARLVPLYSREAGRRVTDRELDIAGRGSQQYDSFATRSSIVGAIAATVTLTFADMFKQEIINDPTTSFSVNLTADPATEPELWKQNVELMRNELSKLGFDDETSAEIISDLSLIQNQLGIVQRRLISRAGSTPMMEMQLQ
jgi:hypothetical protein